MSQIARIHGREILDSRGNPTLEVEVELSPSIRLRQNSEFRFTVLRDAGRNYQTLRKSTRVSGRE